MRIPWLILSSVVVASSCGKNVVAALPDGGDAGAMEEDAGQMMVGPTCLVDTVDAGPTDAGLNFSCRGQTAQMGGQAQFVVTGRAMRGGLTRAPLANVQIDLLHRDGTVLATTTSDDDGGVYSLSIDAGCQPVDGEVRATHLSPDAGFYLSYSLPPTPWRYDRSGLDLVLFDTSTFSLVAAIAGVTVVDQAAVVALTVVDCNGTPVEGATVSASGTAAVRYVTASGLPSSTLTSTSVKGDVIIFNLTGANAEVTATLHNTVIGQRVIPLHANAATGTFITP